VPAILKEVQNIIFVLDGVQAAAVLGKATRTRRAALTTIKASPNAGRHPFEIFSPNKGSSGSA
jgi:hypothetical protein